MRSIYFPALALCCAVLCSCNNSIDKSVNSDKLDKEDISEINAFLVQKDRERIINYIERKGLEMKESPTGLWYSIRSEGTGEYFKDGDRIMMNYLCSLLDGTICYTSETLGPRNVTLGRGELEAGLNEGLRMLKPGGEALFILPPYMAFGLIGDNKSIPPRATIVYEIRVNNRNKD